MARNQKYTRQKDGRYRTTVTLGVCEDGSLLVRHPSAKTVRELDEKVAELKREYQTEHDAAGQADPQRATLEEMNQLAYELRSLIGELRGFLDDYDSPPACRRQKKPGDHGADTINRAAQKGFCLYPQYNAAAATRQPPPHIKS